MALILNGTDGLSDVDGSASTPAIRGTDTNTGIFFPAADTIAFAEGGVESMRIDSSGNVGIGTSSPSRQLTVNKTAIFDSNGDGTTTLPSIAIGSTGVGLSYIGSQQLAFITNSAERMRITSDGSVLIGGTTDTAQTAGFLVIQRTSTPGLDLFRNETAIVDTSVLGQIRFLGNDTTSNLPAQLAYIRATASGTHSAGDNPTDLVFGTTPDNTASVAEAGRITQSGAYILKGGTLNPGGTGITFPATQSASSDANTLDDYEEGTFTPFYQPATGSFSSITYTEQFGTYTKIGNRVFVQGRIRTNSLSVGTASGALSIAGLPFTVLNNSSTSRNSGSLSIVSVWGGDAPSALYAEAGTTYMTLLYRTSVNGSTTDLLVSDMATGSNSNQVFYSLCYIV